MIQILFQQFNVSRYIGLFCSLHFGKEIKPVNRRSFRAYPYVAEKHKVAIDWLGFIARILDHGLLLCTVDSYGTKVTIGTT